MTDWRVPRHDVCVNAGNNSISYTDLYNQELKYWMTTGWDVLLLKDKNKGNGVSRYRPITLMWEFLPGIVADIFI